MLSFLLSLLQHAVLYSDDEYIPLRFRMLLQDDNDSSCLESSSISPAACSVLHYFELRYDRQALEMVRRCRIKELSRLDKTSYTTLNDLEGYFKLV